MPRKSRRSSRRFDEGSGLPAESEPAWTPPEPERPRRVKPPEETNPDAFEDDLAWQPEADDSVVDFGDRAFGAETADAKAAGAQTLRPDDAEAGPGQPSPVLTAGNEAPSEAEISEDPETTFVITPEQAGERLDALLAARFPRHSRTRLRQAIVAGTVTVNGERAKVAYRVVPGERVAVTLPEILATGPKPEPIPLSILFEDEDLIVLDKPPGMVVHPARGHWAGTLAGAVAYHCRSLSTVGGAVRPGIVHRLDRDTSGVIVVAKTDAAHLSLAGQFERRTVEKEYWSLVSPPPGPDRDWIDLPIGPHGKQRERMAVRPDHPAARPARTFFDVVARRGGVGFVKAFPKTGRTHQIRVHFAARGFAILADALYGGRKVFTVADLFELGRPHEALRGGAATPRSGWESAGITDEAGAPVGPAFVVLDRQALHARRLTFDHPRDGRRLTITAPVPGDMARCLAVLGLADPDA